MSRRAWPERVRDILSAVREIQTFVAGVTFAEFAANPEKIKAVLADFAIIGEAAAHIPDDIKATHPLVAWGDMRRMRNLIVHVYFAIEPRIVWDTIHNELPPLVPLLEAMLASP